MHDELGAAAQSLLRHRIHVADDDVGGDPLVEQGVGSPVDGDHHRLHLPQVGGPTQQAQVLLVAGAADHDQDLAAGPVGVEIRQLEVVVDQVGVVLEVLDGVLDEAVQLRSEGGPAPFVDPQDRVLVLSDADGDLASVDDHGVALDRRRVSLGDSLHESVTEGVDQRDPGAQQQQRPLVGVATRR